jgi:hypothetical protein
VSAVPTLGDFVVQIGGDINRRVWAVLLACRLSASS